MGLDPQISAGEFGVAFVAVLLVVTTFATLGIIRGFDGVYVDPVAAMALRLVVAAEVIHGQIVSRTAAGVAIQAEFLGVALVAVLDCLARQNTVSPHPVAVMVGSDTFRLVTVIALGYLHFGIILVRLFLGHRLMHVKN
jgi:hypothetical protein